jgi:putative ABC transport system permease protein
MKRLLAIVRVSLRALLRNLLRSVLTMLGVIIGVASVIALVGLGRGARASVDEQISGLGQNLVLVMSGATQSGGVATGLGGAGTLTLGDADAIRREVEGVRYVSPEVRGPVQVAAGAENWNTSVLGAGHEYPLLRNFSLTAGDFFTAQDERAGVRVVVLGATVAKQLFPDARAVGEQLRIGNVPFTIVGVLEAKGASLSGQDQDDMVIVPHVAAMRRLLGLTHLRAINVGASGPEAIDEMQRQITALLRQRHRISPGRDDDFSVQSLRDVGKFATNTLGILTGLLGAVAGVSLLVGGIGIMNIMLVSVTERTREIGIRLAVGARRRDILRQFLIEAVVISALGGLLGVVVGYLIASVVAQQLGWAAQVSLSVVLGAVAFSAAVGIFFGYYPARRAAHLDPIHALRHE